jgi:UDP-MurNAc hydroxylase
VRVRYLASASVVVEHGGTRVLCDPWFTDGIYYGAWCHNPPCPWTPEAFHDVDALYISHIHQDHCDLATLKRLRKGTPVYLAPYAEPFLATMLRGRGFPVRVLQPGARADLGGGLHLELMAADLCDPQACGQWIGCPLPHARPDVSYQVDSLAVFSGGGRVVVNLNDCPLPLVTPALARIRAAYGAVDLVLKTYASAGPYPQCFPDLGPDGMRRAAAAKQRRFIDWAHEVVDRLGARRWLPFAGQYTLAGRLARLNPYRGVPELAELPDHPAMVRLNRGAWWDVDRDQASEAWVPEDPAERARYEREVLAGRTLAYERDDLPEADPAELDAAITRWRARVAARGFRIRSTLWLGVGASRRLLHAGDGSAEVTVSGDPRLLHWLLHRKAHWNAAEVGSHLTYHRTPDTYERAAYYALSYLHL